MSLADTSPILPDVDACLNEIHSILSPPGMTGAFNLNDCDNYLLENAGYSITDPQIPLWEAQYRMNTTLQAPYSHTANFPAIQHNFPSFLEKRGANTNDIVNEEGLRFLISNHSEHRCSS